MQKNSHSAKRPSKLAVAENSYLNLSDAKAQFLNKVSHELRTPLSVIKMYVEAIEDGMYENNDEAFQRLREKFEEFEGLMNEMIKQEKKK